MPIWIQLRTQHQQQICRTQSINSQSVVFIPHQGVDNKGTSQSREHTSSTSTINSHNTPDRRPPTHQTKHNHNHPLKNNNNNHNNNRNEINTNDNTLTAIGQRVHDKIITKINEFKPSTTTTPINTEQTITFTQDATITGKKLRCVRKTSRKRDPQRAEKRKEREQQRDTAKVIDGIFSQQRYRG